MNKPNYEKKMERLIASFNGEKPSLLLHCCCGPCSAAVLEYLSRHFRITVLWYNPNIFPESEHDRRLENLKKLVKALELNEIELLEKPYAPADYLEGVKGLENEPEGGARCTECFRIRIRKAAEKAAEIKADYFCTTLSLSRHKDAERINRLGEVAAAEFGVKWLPSDFKKKDRETRSYELCSQYDIYRQLYCGCGFSLKNRIDNAESPEEAARIFEGVREE